MEEILNEITNTIQDYKRMKSVLVFNDTEYLSTLMKDLSSNLFFLEAHLSDARDEYYSTIVKLLKNHSATEAEKRAKDLHPEKRMLERFLTSGYKVLDSIRSHISLLKTEKNG